MADFELASAQFPNSETSHAGCGDQHESWYSTMDNQVYLFSGLNSTWWAATPRSLAVWGRRRGNVPCCRRAPRCCKGRTTRSPGGGLARATSGRAVGNSRPHWPRWKARQRLVRQRSRGTRRAWRRQEGAGRREGRARGRGSRTGWKSQALRGEAQCPGGGDGGGAALHPHQPQQLPRQAVAVGEQSPVPLDPLGRPWRGAAHRPAALRGRAAQPARGGGRGRWRRRRWRRRRRRRCGGHRGRARALQNHQLHQLHPTAQPLRLPQDKGVPFPVLQRFPTEVTYTLQPSATSVHVQQGPQTMVSSSQKYSNYTPSAQYSQAYYPTAVLQCCSPSTHMDALSSCVTPTASSYAHCNYFQNPPMQSSYPVEFLPSNWPCGTTDENKKTEVNLEAVFQIVDELHSSPKLEMVKVEPVENQCPTSQSNRGQHIVANSNNSNPSSTSQASQLEPLTPVGSDITSFVVGTEQAITCSLPQSPEYIYTIHTAQPVENTTMQESAAIQQAHVKLKEQLSHNPSPSSVVFVQEGLPFSTHQVDASIKCQANPPENILPSEHMGFLISEMGPASKPSKDTGLSTPARYRERRSNSQQGKSPDLHLLVDVACKQEHFPKEEELKE
ncbi:heat shock factor protein 5 isoform X2 [Felis catus]|uniref:heat shock factor protein 5 isoform X2 n=1 Tax=Felis catus TaxID=9685 RepID=UPI001D19F6B4|nr:heat shock factor protein 5 isoform X2 [Felis catus]